jgi:hypothetical protein
MDESSDEVFDEGFEGFFEDKFRDFLLDIQTACGKGSSFDASAFAFGELLDPLPSSKG